MLTGTGALVSAQALKAAGGFDERTVTEDIVTGAKIQAQGFDSCYHPQPVAYGRVPLSLSGILRQRLRWAQGSFQLGKSWRSSTRGLSLRQKLTYFSGIFYFLMAMPSIVLALLPPLILIFGLDASLHYSTASLCLLAFFVILRYFAREAYCKKTPVERAAGNYLTLIYAPVYVYAIVTALFRRSLAFWTSPKERSNSSRFVRRDIALWSVPLLIAGANIAAVIWLGLHVVVTEYPWPSFLLDYAGIILLALYFACAGLSLAVLEE
jgi:cellulose synthase (UDP-forming)